MEFVSAIHDLKTENAKELCPVAVFDSGVGGISVLSELCRLMPCEDYLYFGDSKNAPYGTKSSEEVLALTDTAVNRMIGLGCKAVVLACNTATSAAAKYLRRQYEAVPIIGMEPEIKTPVITNHNRILIMATPMTLQLEKFNRLLGHYADRAELIVLPCPGLAELVEAGPAAAYRISHLLLSLLAPYRENPVDAVVLGCTHYPHIKAEISKALGYDVTFYDGGAGTAREVRRRLSDAGLLTKKTIEGRILIENSLGKDMIELSKMLFLEGLETYGASQITMNNE